MNDLGCRLHRVQHDIDVRDNVLEIFGRIVDQLRFVLADDITLGAQAVAITASSQTPELKMSSGRKRCGDGCCARKNHTAQMEKLSSFICIRQY
jgi:hypothetical protein